MKHPEPQNKPRTSNAGAVRSNKNLFKKRDFSLDKYKINIDGRKKEENQFDVSPYSELS